MKKLILFAFLLYSSTMFSQDAVATADEIKQFYKTKTYVVYDESMFNSYNGKIEDAIKLNWKLTKYEFIDMKKFHKLRKDPNNSFLIKTKVLFKGDKSKTPYSFLSLLLGNKKASTTLKNMPDLCSFPLSYYNVSYDKYDYKLGAIVKFMQNHVELTKSDPSLNNKNIMRHYNKNSEKMQDKTLYVIKKELAKDINTLKKIKKYYKGKVKIVSAEDIKKAIEQKDENVVFLHKVGPAAKTKKKRIYKLILGASDGKMYYVNFHKYKSGKRPDSFLSKDLKKLKRKN